MSGMRAMTRLRPRVGTMLAVTAATVLSLLPAVLPRTSATQAVLTGVLGAMAIGIAGVLRTVLRRRGFDLEERWGTHRVPVMLVCGFALAAATVNATHWQSGLRAAMSMAPVGPEYWLRAAVGAAIAGGLLVWVFRGVRGLLRLLTGSGRRANVTVLPESLPDAVDVERPEELAASGAHGSV
ncbi:putative membrane protein [Nocardia sp. GAS34]|uniref:alpha/beta-hydrolase N-terminal domain-containing protein n=1 Tax=unclassified Nocardia TaxID=2637762 RepID=UPI003D246BC5